MVLDGASDSFPLLWKGAWIKFKIFFSRKALGLARLLGNEFLLFGVGEWASGELLRAAFVGQLLSNPANPEPPLPPNSSVVPFVQPG